MTTVRARRVPQHLIFAPLALSLAGCGASAVHRSLTICGVHVTTDARASIAVAADVAGEPGRSLAYAMLGPTGGSLTVGDTTVERMQLRFAVDAEIWITDATGTAKKIEFGGAPALLGANVDRSSIELRGGKGDASLPASVGDTVVVSFDGTLHVVHSK